MSVVTPDRVWLLSQSAQDAIWAWLVSHDLDPNRTASFSVDGDMLAVDYYLLNDEGKFYVTEANEVARESLTVAVRTPAPLLPL